MRYDIINRYISEHNLSSYLEIGFFDGFCFDRINCQNKIAVDPNPLVKRDNVIVKTSDSYFEELNDNTKFDFIFIDGLHHSDQVDNDITNSLRHLSEHGFIMLHDTNPLTELAQVVPRKTKVWNGDVWKSVVKFRVNNIDMIVYTYALDNGCTIITSNPKKLSYYNPLDFNLDDLDYSKLKSNRKKLLNTI